MAGRTVPTDPVAPDALLRLDIAAKLAFPDGSIVLSSLKREVARGRLTIWRVANKDMTTLAEIRSMVERCRVQPSRPAYGSDQAPPIESRSGSSSMEDVRSARAAAKLRVQRLRDGFSSTSPRSAIPTPSQGVVPIRPR